MIKQNDADVASLKQVQGSKSKAYTSLKNSLGMSNAALINFVKVIINLFNIIYILILL